MKVTESDGTYRGLDAQQVKVAADIATHPERKALANLYTGLAALCIPIFVILMLSTPAVIWWAYSTATR